VIRRKLGKQRDRVCDELEQAADEEYPAHDIAMSFSVGVFITALPTLGFGVLLFFVIAFLFARAHKIALFASVLILNPVVKWGVYGLSISLGVLLLGPIEELPTGLSFTARQDVTNSMLSAGPGVIARLWLGNTILAVLFAAIGYVFAIRVVRAYRDRVSEGACSSSAVEL
jgi:uncharacterized protein (DUF2062 family)